MSGPAIEALGWSLVHFLWQGALVALALEALLYLLRERSARLRYALRCAALGIMGLLPVATFLWLLRGAATPPALPARIEEYLAAVQATGAAGPGPMGWLVTAWALGASACAARVLRDYARIRRLQSSSAGCPLPLDWQVRFEHLARRMNVRAVVRVIDSAALAAPTVIGWLKPVVLVPARALTGLSSEQLEVVLVHELAHVRRHDYLVNLVQAALEALLFYQPAVWWVSHGIRAEREFCCDDAALSLSSDGVVYARALATLESWRNVQPELALSTLGGPLMTRIQRLIGIRPSSRPVRGPLAALGALLVIGSATAFANQPSDGQDPEQLRLIRQHLEEMQERLDELRAMLNEVSGDEDSPFSYGWVEAGEVDPEANVWFFDESGEGSEIEPGVEFEWTAEEDEQGADSEVWAVPLAGMGGKRAIVLRDGGDDEDQVVIRVDGGNGDREGLGAKIRALIDGHRQSGARARDAERDRRHAELLERELHEEHGRREEHTEELHRHLRQLHEEHDGDQGHAEKLHRHLRQLHEERDGDQGHMRELHDHLRALLHGADDRDRDREIDGEAEIEVIIKRAGEPEQRIRKRVPMRGAFKLRPRVERDGNLELFFGREDSDDVNVFELDSEDSSWFDAGDSRYEFRTFGDDDGDSSYWFRAGDDGHKTRLLDLKRRAEEDRARAGEQRRRVFELKKTLGESKANSEEVWMLEKLPLKGGGILFEKKGGPFNIELQRTGDGGEGPEGGECEDQAPVRKVEAEKREIV